MKIPGNRTSIRARVISILAVVVWFIPTMARTASSDLPLIHPIFDSHMVLQRDAEDPVWGWADPATVVTVEVKDPDSGTIQTKTAAANTEGRWEVKVGPFSANEKGISLVISREGQAPVTLTDVLVGDVWLCSGQSNMARSLARHNGIPDVLNQDAEIADTIHYPFIRQYYLANLASAQPQSIPTAIKTDETGSSGPWLINGPEAARLPSRYSALAYFFARDLYRTLRVPIGIVQMSWGGTSIEAWIDPSTLSEDPNFRNAAMPAKPGTNNGGAIYNGKVATIIPFNFKGVVWYQGENNDRKPEQYRTLLPLLFKSWRQMFQQPELPFIVIQLPNFENQNWPILREAQLNAVLKDDHSRLVVTIDLGDPKQLHPNDKQDVASRAALAALDLAYGQKGVASGPFFSKATLAGNKVRCEFDRVGAGLMVGQREIPPTQPGLPTTEVIGGSLKGFEIAGSDGNFFPATAIIQGKEMVEVFSPEVASPVSVRYAWAGAPLCNLYNKITNDEGMVVDGLPASPFRIHTCFDGLDQWCYQSLAGFQKILIKPAVVGDLTWVKALRTPSRLDLERMGTQKRALHSARRHPAGYHRDDLRACDERRFGSGKRQTLSAITQCALRA